MLFNLVVMRIVLFTRNGVVVHFMKMANKTFIGRYSVSHEMNREKGRKKYEYLLNDCLLLKRRELRRE